MTTSGTPGFECEAAHALLRSRNRDDALDAPAQWNAVLETILNHRSVRGFLPDALPDGTLELLVAAAQSASTSSNLQLWSVVAVQEPARKSRLATLAGDQQFIRDAPLLLVWLADLARIDGIAAQRQQSVEGTQYLEEFIVGVVDAALAAQSALLAAESLGLGGVYIGAMRNLPEAIADALKLPPHVFAVFGMAIGWPDPARATDIKPRLPQRVVLHRETYDAAAKSDGIAEYDAIMREFQAEQGMRLTDWSVQCIARVKDAAALRGRDRMREALRNLGFELR
ncbi:MAG TPA: NADPH-dependent oxidoreductase [Acetobacteraceae bacterium]